MREKPITQETICNLCLTQIDTKKDSYCRLTDYYKGKFFMEGLYHHSCYLQRINNSNRVDPELNAQLKTAMGLAGNLLKQAVGDPKDKGYTVITKTKKRKR